MTFAHVYIVNYVFFLNYAFFVDLFARLAFNWNTSVLVYLFDSRMFFKHLALNLQNMIFIVSVSTLDFSFPLRSWLVHSTIF